MAFLRAMKRVLCAILCLLPLFGWGERIKDIGFFQGVRPNELIGYGLVVGLNGTGDKRGSWFTVQSLVNMLSQMGVSVPADQLKVKNVAAVMVTAKLPPFAKPGTKIDVLVSSIGDATSLQGGTLLLTPLRGADGKVYAVAQGPILVGGMGVKGAATQVIVNVPTVGRIPGGAIVEREVPLDLSFREEIRFNLYKPDFTTAKRVKEAIEKILGKGTCKVEDGSSILIFIPPSLRGDVPGLLATIEGLEVMTDEAAKVVVDERTGTIVIGKGVRIKPVAVAHGNISVQIKERPRVVQPQPFAPGRTVVVPETEVKVEEEVGHLQKIEGATVGELVEALNALGVTPRDLIAILQAIKAAGALEGELEVI
jgi:flagellar P-ring protein precursor FlgI